MRFPRTTIGCSVHDPQSTITFRTLRDRPLGAGPRHLFVQCKTILIYENLYLRPNGMSLRACLICATKKVVKQIWMKWNSHREIVCTARGDDAKNNNNEKKRIQKDDRIHKTFTSIYFSLRFFNFFFQLDYTICLHYALLCFRICPMSDMERVRASTSGNSLASHGEIHTRQLDTDAATIRFGAMSLHSVELRWLDRRAMWAHSIKRSDVFSCYFFSIEKHQRSGIIVSHFKWFL